MTDTLPPHSPTPSSEELVHRYGHLLSGEELTDAQSAAVLEALFHIMTGFVDLGFSIKAGDKFTSKCALGMDDVLDYLIPQRPAPETPASPETKQD
ncbi:MAG: hypothetical protein AAF317_02285 [Pseudomonadota bacterium]